MRNTAKVDLASEETDVEAVKEHLHKNTTEKERQAVIDLMDLVLNGCDEEDVQEKVEKIKSDLEQGMIPIEMDDSDELEDAVRKSAEGFKELKNHPRGEKVAEMIDVTIGYFYREDVDYKEIVRIKERTRANNGDMSVTIPI